MAMTDEYDFGLGEGVQQQAANLKPALDIDGLDLALKNMDVLVLLNNSALEQATQYLTQFSVILEKILPRLTILQTAAAIAGQTNQAVVVAGDKNGDGVTAYDSSPGQGMNKLPMTVKGWIELSYSLNMTDDEVSRRLLNSGFSVRQLAQAEAEAEALRKEVKSTSKNGNLNFIYNLNRIFNNPEKSMAAAEILLKGGVVVDSTARPKEIDIDKDGFYASQLDELSDKFYNPKTRQINQVVAKVLSKGLADFVLGNSEISPRAFVGMAYTAGPKVVSQMDSDATFASIAPIIAAMKGVNVAPALTALGQAFKPAAMSIEALSALRGIGVTPGGALYKANPGAWLEDVLIPALDKHGIDTPGQQSAFLDKVLKGTTYLPKLQGLIDHLEKIEQYKRNYQYAAENPRNNYNYLAAHDLGVNVNSALDALDEFWALLGQAGTSQVVAGLKSLTNFVNAVDHYTAHHRELALLGMDLAYLAALAGTLFGGAKSAAKTYGFAKKLFGKDAGDAKFADEMGADEAGTSLVAGVPEIALEEAGAGAFATVTGLTAGTDLPVIAAIIGGYELWAHRKFLNKEIQDHLGPRDPFSSYDETYLYDDAYDIYSWTSFPFYNPGSFQKDGPDKIYNVYIVNPDDIHAGTARAFSQHWSVPAGPTGHNGALTMPLTSGSIS